MITKEQIARAYALMECERAPNVDVAFGNYPAKRTADLFLGKGLIREWEWMKFLNNEYPHSQSDPFREEFLDLFAMYEHENPLPSGQRYWIELENFFPVAQDISRGENK